MSTILSLSLNVLNIKLIIDAYCGAPESKPQDYHLLILFQALVASTELRMRFRTIIIFHVDYLIKRVPIKGLTLTLSLTLSL